MSITTKWIEDYSKDKNISSIWESCKNLLLLYLSTFFDTFCNYNYYYLRKKNLEE